MTVGYDKNGNVIEIYGLTSGGGGGGGDVTMAQVRAEIAKNVGKGVQLGFDGTLASGTITFEPPASSGTYTIKENYDYEIDLSFQATSTTTMDDDTAMVIKNGSDTIQFWTVKDSPATWGDLKDIYTYSTDTGYRWLFKARFHVTSSGTNVFYIFPAVDNSLTSVQLYSDGNAIYDKQGGTALTYTQIYDLISSKYNLVSINYDSVIIMYPVFWDGSAISFSNTYIYDNKCWQQRLIINSDNQVLFDEYEVLTSSSAANTDLSNLTTTGKSFCAGAGMPSTNYIDLELGTLIDAQNTVTVPANGYIVISKNSTDENQYLEIGVNGGGNNRCYSTASSQPLKMKHPVAKGNCYVAYNIKGTTNYFRFYYAQGEI